MNPETRQQIEDFLYTEARLLDQRDYEQWVALFAEDGIYWVPAGDEADPNESVALIYDNKKRLEERLIRIGSNRFWAQQPVTQTCRIVGNVVATEAAGDEIEVRSRLIMTVLRRDRKELLSGVCDFRLRQEGDGYLIVNKTVRLIEREQHFDNLTFLI